MQIMNHDEAIRLKAAEKYLLGELSAEYRSGIRHDFLLPDDVHSTAAGVTASRDSHTSDQILVRFGTVFGSTP